MDTQTTEPSSAQAAGLLRLDGRTALVIGASRGIGRAIACSLAAAGADVAVAARTMDDLEHVAAEIRGLGRRTRARALNLAETERIRPVVDEVAEEWGRLDILVNSAGVTAVRPALELDEAEWDRVMDVNLKGAFFAAQSAARHMLARGHGRIINVASATSIGALEGVCVYGASKGGVSALTRQLAVEWAPLGITVNAIAPGWVRTALTARRVADSAWLAQTERRIPLHRLGEPSDMGGLAVFLASDASAYVTGQTIVADGGLTIDLTTRLEQ